METNEIMAVNDVIEVAEEFAIDEPKFGIGKGLAIGAGVVLAGALTYKFIVKPIVNKIKSKKDAVEIEEATVTVIDDEEVTYED